MKRVTGIGGIFFKAHDAEKLRKWYKKHLGLEAQGQSGVSFNWHDAEQPGKTGQTVWSVFPRDTDYFDPSNASFMINYRVENLDWLLEQPRDEGFTSDRAIEEYEYGRFAWISDPEGNRIELWEPK
jgi:predicted enzyme related to lactoylglutathione lyase